MLFKNFLGSSDKAIMKKSRYFFGNSKYKESKDEREEYTKKGNITYFFITPQKLVKIGKTKNLKRRLRHAETMNYGLKLLGTVTIPEKTVQHIFSEFRIDDKREWFRFDETMVDYLYIHKSDIK